VTVQQHSSYRQKGKGRPGKDTEYVRSVQQSWSFEAMPHEERIQQEAAVDGMFPLITNISDKDLPMREVLLKYKYQPYIEKRHQQFKSVLEAAPVFLKLPHRVEALMFIYFYGPSAQRTHRTGTTTGHAQKRDSLSASVP